MILNKIYDRTVKLIGEDGLCLLRNANILIFGVGGVGGYIVEALVRAGIGNLTIVDKDFVDATNKNRQIIALDSTLGMAKVNVLTDRAQDINSECLITPINIEYIPGDESIDFSKYDYIVDAIDDIRAKIDIIERAKKYCIPIISSMGTGNKLNPFLFKIDDISKTSVCPLAKKIRKELKNRDIKGVKVLYSTEEKVSSSVPPGTISYMPSIAGLMIASEVIRDILEIK
ncbi:MAG: tRNA threonylcarbamoyladenosine dehydratase [Eubacteriales bacterium]|nr:tRNA threonylcarbamoyladenosine dehydratase [Eubacteriales bacterium]MDY3332601.1 tRNA threonylcarbamoyladenosine dehydratase [Gallibacter sp.]